MRKDSKSFLARRPGGWVSRVSYSLCAVSPFDSLPTAQPCPDDPFKPISRETQRISQIRNSGFILIAAAAAAANYFHRDEATLRPLWVRLNARLWTMENSTKTSFIEYQKGFQFWRHSNGKLFPVETTRGAWQRLLLIAEGIPLRDTGPLRRSVRSSVCGNADAEGKRCSAHISVVRGARLTA